MLKISAVIITRDEEERIVPTLQSLDWVDEIVVVDTHSQDRTRELCRKYTDRVYVREWKGYVEQKNYVLQLASHDWVLSLDADERVSEELRAEIGELIKEGMDCDGYYISRKVFYLGRWIKHCGWYPDYKMRLFKKSRARWVGGSVHESCLVEGKVGYLRSPLLHYTYRNISEHLSRNNLYAELSAQDKFHQGERAGIAKLIFFPMATFIKTYFIKLGFLEGVAGLIISVISATYVFLKYAKLWDMWRIEKREKSSPGIK
ncbi:MAG: glycosyltransferase family 2 protein [Acidobacteriota bacterium]